MAETMGTAERTVRMIYGSAATVYFCSPEVTLAGALSFGAAAVILLLAIVAGVPRPCRRMGYSAAEPVDSFTA